MSTAQAASAYVNPAWCYATWQRAARAALQAGIPPHALHWSDDTRTDLLTAPDVLDLAPAAPRAIHVPRSFPDLAARLLCYRDRQRHALAYRLLWRLQHGERHLLATPTDADVAQAGAWAQAVQRASHKMKAFVRFRAVPDDPSGLERFVAWFEPAHDVLDRIAPFFQQRFTGMDWTIITPYRSVRWDGAQLAFGGGGAPADAPAQDAQEALWQAYYAHIFNPARLNPRMMRQEMPQRYWKLLPEAQRLPDLIRNAGPRTQAMTQATPSAATGLPGKRRHARPPRPTATE